MSIVPKSLNNLVEELGKLPGVGPRTAERYAFNLLKKEPGVAKSIAKALDELHEGIKYCPVTFLLIEDSEDVSPLYSSSERDKQTIAVIEEPLDVLPIEKTGYKGTYHVLGGALSPIDGIGPEQLHVKELVKRVKEDKVKEVIIATNASVEGESTALLIQNSLEKLDQKLKVTRLARGIPAGIDLEYADKITLTKAMEGRQTF